MTTLWETTALHEQIQSLQASYARLYQEADANYPRLDENKSILLAQINASLTCQRWLEALHTNPTQDRIRFYMRWSRRHQGSYSRSAINKTCELVYGRANAEIFRQCAESLRSLLQRDD